MRISQTIYIHGFFSFPYIGKRKISTASQMMRIYSFYFAVSLVPQETFPPFRGLRREICNLPLRLLQIDRIVSDAPDPVECALAPLSMALCQIFRWIEICSCPEACTDKRSNKPSWIYRAPSRYIERALRNSSSHSYDCTAKQYEIKSLIRHSLFGQSEKINEKKTRIKKILFKYEINNCM